MKKTTRILLAGAALLTLGLATSSAWSQSTSSTYQNDWCRLRRAEAELEARLARAQAQYAAAQGRYQENLTARLEGLQTELAARQAQLYARLAAQQTATAPRVADGDLLIDLEGDSGWLGVSIEEVSADKAKDLKLSAVHGALITEVDSDSPAAKAGLKVNDVVTEYNGQRVEGTAQLRRLIRETPPGHTAQLTVWREGRSQNLSVTLGDYSDQVRKRMRIVTPRGAFEFNIPNFNFNFDRGGIITTLARGPVLGIGVQDLSGQLGNYFGAPDGEGVLVTEVNSGSPAEKAGMKAGDVITKIDGTRVRTSNDLRSELRNKRDKKSVAVTVLRRGSETSLNVEIEQPKPPTLPAARKSIRYRTI